MRLPECTIDTSCVIALDHLDLLPRLSLLFSKVLLPWAVRQELYRRRTTKKRIRSLIQDFDFFEECDEYDQLAVKILLAERNRLPGKDRGEAEAVVQATEVGATVVVDDSWGRKLAQK